MYCSLPVLAPQAAAAGDDRQLQLLRQQELAAQQQFEQQQQLLQQQQRQQLEAMQRQQQQLLQQQRNLMMQVRWMAVDVFLQFADIIVNTVLHLCASQRNVCIGGSTLTKFHRLQSHDLFSAAAGGLQRYGRLCSVRTRL